MSIDLNCDLGESYGIYTLGMDQKVLPLVTSANVACGGHAGDSAVMARTVTFAKQYGTAVGAHPGFWDKEGFGRRYIAMAEDDIYELCLYQIGALHAFCEAGDVQMQHVKPHGALYNSALRDPATAKGVARAVKDFNKDLLLFAPVYTELQAAGEKAGIGGMEGRELESGDILYRGAVHDGPRSFERRLPAASVPVYEKQQTLRVVAGPEFDTLTAEAGTKLLREAYVVTQEADRMGIRLEGPEVSFHYPGDIISDGVAFGTIQLASDGQPMILMADRQTTGGYARVLNVISADLSKAAQLQPNASVMFEQVTLEEAQIAYKQLHRSLEDVYFAVKNKKWR